MRWFSIAKSKGVANRDPHRGLHVLGTTHQGRPDLGLPLEGDIKMERKKSKARHLGQMVK